MPTASPVIPPAVSVVVPLYNKRATIGRTIESILAQGWTDFELLVVDDGSTDGGPAFVEATYTDPRVRLHRQANAGPGAARNHGLALTTGRYVTFLDADDAWRPQLLETAVAILDRHADCGAFTASFMLEPMAVDRWGLLAGYNFHEGPWRLGAEIPKSHLRHCLDAFHPTTTVYRREVIEAFGGFYTEERCTFGEDVYLWLQVMLHHGIYRHMTPLAHYHTEDSELGWGGRKGAFPIEPVLTHPEPIRAGCPPTLRDVLELWLAQHAVRAAFMQLDRGDTERAQWLVAHFPRSRAWPSDYLKLRLRLAMPGLWSFARQVSRAKARGATSR